jgi:hypothetical protein
MSLYSERRAFELFNKFLDDGTFSIDENGYVWRHKILHHKNVEFLEEPIRAEYTLPNGYLQIQMYQSGKVITASVHRLIWQLYTGVIPDGNIVHHKNGVRNDNRIVNLMCITHKEHLKIHPRRPAAHDSSSKEFKKWHKRSVETRVKRYRQKALKIYRDKTVFGVSARELADTYNCTTRSIYQAVLDCERRGWLQKCP